MSEQDMSSDWFEKELELFYDSDGKSLDCCFLLKDWIVKKGGDNFDTWLSIWRDYIESIKIEKLTPKKPRDLWSTEDLEMIEGLIFSNE